MACETDPRVERILAEISPSARVLCLNAPEGTDVEPVVDAWLSTGHPLQPTDPEDAAVQTFLADTGSTLEDAFREQHPGVLVMRTRQAGVTGVDVEKLLTALPQARIVLIVTVSAMAVESSERLYSRDDTVILFPESLYYTTSELTALLGDSVLGHQCFEATLGWPAAVRIWRRRLDDPDYSAFPLMRTCALAMARWVWSLPLPDRELIYRLAYIPRFNRIVGEELRGSQHVKALSARLLENLGLGRRIGARGAHDDQNTGGWWAMPSLVAEALRNHMSTIDPVLGERYRHQALMALAAGGAWSEAIERAVEWAVYDTTAELIRRYWAIAAVQDEELFLSSLRDFFHLGAASGSRTEFQHRGAFLAGAFSVNDDAVFERFRSSFTGIGVDEEDIVSEGGTPQLGKLVVLLIARTNRQAERAHALAVELTEYLVDHMAPAEESSLLRHAEYALIWQQLGYTFLLAADGPRAVRAYRKALHLCSAQGFDELQKKCVAQLRLLQSSLEILFPGQTMVGALTGLNVEDTGGYFTRSHHDAVALARGFDALWDLDGDGLRNVLDEFAPTAQSGELWPFSAFLTVVYESIFGDWVRARRLLLDYASTRGADRGTWAQLLDAAEVVYLMMEGSHSKVVELTRNIDSGRAAVLLAGRTAAQMALGDFESLRRIRLPGPAVRDGDALLPATTLDVLRAYADSVTDGVDAAAELKGRLPRDTPLFITLSLWCIGASEEDIARIFDLDEERRHRLRSIRRGTETVPQVRPQLTERERAIIVALAQGMDRSQMARTMYLSVNTIKTQLSSAYRKLGASNRHDAVEEATRRGYV